MRASVACSSHDDLALFGATVLIAAVGVFAACRADVDPAPTVPAPTEVAASAVAAERAPASPPGEADADDPPVNPLAGMEPAAGPKRFDAVVAERVRAGGYAYLRLTLPDGGERWLATMGDGEPTGVQVTVRSYGERENFHSRRTGKTFARLLFGEAEPRA